MTLSILNLAGQIKVYEMKYVFLWKRVPATDPVIKAGQSEW